MECIDLYKSRLTVHGNTSRDRSVYEEKRHIRNNAESLLACKQCIVGGRQQQLIINDGTLPYYKNITSLPDEYFEAGDLIEWADCMWIVVSCDWDKEIYTYGKIQQCNYLMKWQLASGDVVERWSVILTASKYNNGEKENAVITVGSNQLMAYLPIDSECLKLKSGIRLMIDYNTEQPKCYEITRVDTVVMGYDGVAIPVYDGKGCVLLVLTECEFNIDTDRVDLMLCDYVDPNDIPQPTTPLYISYSGSPEIRIGGRKTFSIDSQLPITFSLTVIDMWKDKVSLTRLSVNSCRVVCENNADMVGTKFKLTATDGSQAGEIVITVKGAV